jgi:hypothetical protein
MYAVLLDVIYHNHKLASTHIYIYIDTITSIPIIVLGYTTHINLVNSTIVYRRYNLLS